jgi:large subunit ribosomal protein L20
MRTRVSQAAEAMLVGGKSGGRPAVSAPFAYSFFQERLMPRARCSPATRARRKKILKAAKGYVGGRSRTFKQAKETVHRAWCYAYRDRKVRKREFRRLWVARINAASRSNGLPYSRLIDGLNKAGVILDRKVLADLAVSDASVFSVIVQQAKAALSA